MGLVCLGLMGLVCLPGSQRFIRLARRTGLMCLGLMGLVCLVCLGLVCLANGRDCSNNCVKSSVRIREALILLGFRGKAAFESVLADSSYFPTDLAFEDLLYVAANAYERKTGKKFLSMPAFNFETGSNKQGWQ